MKSERSRLHRAETKLGLGAFGVRFGLAPRLLRRRFESAQPAHFVHDSLGVEFAFQAFESTIDGLSFANDDFRHVVEFRLNLKVRMAREARLGAELRRVNEPFTRFLGGAPL